MAKSKPSKKALSKARRHNPIRIPDSHLPSGSAPGTSSSSNTNPNTSQQLLPVLAKLSSTSDSDRAWAASTISTLISNDPATRRLFLGKNVLEKLVNLLSDSSGTVRVEGSGALRNLAIDGGHEVCGAMYNKQVLTPLQVLVPQLSERIQLILSEQAPPAGSDKAPGYLDGNQVFALAENVLTLFWCLSETSNKILTALNAMSGLSSFFLAFITHREKIPSGAVLAAAQCLYAITLDNPPFSSQLSGGVVQDLLRVVQSDEVKMMEETAAPVEGKGKQEGMEVETEKSQAAQSVSQDKTSLLRVLIAGVLHNLNDDGAEVIEGLDNRVVGPLLRPVLDVNLAQVVQEVIKTVPEIPAVSEKDAKEIKNIKADLRSPAEIKLDGIEKRLSTLMVALEVMTSVCAGLVDAEEAVATGEDEADEEEDADEEMDMDGEADVDEALIAKGREQVGDDSMMVEQPRRTGSTSLDGLMGSNMHTRLFALAQSTELSYPPASGGLSLHPPSTAFLSSIHLRALEALNNLLLTISSFAPPPAPPLPASVQDVTAGDRKARSEWKQFVQQSFTNLDELWAGSFEIAKQIIGVGAEGTPTGQELLGMKGQEVRKDALEVLAGVWVGLARIGSYGGLNITQEQITGLTQVYTLLPSTNLKTRIISALSTLSMVDALPVEQNKIIGDLFISLVSASGTTGVSTEEIVAALNAIFDVYADERCSYNEVFNAGGYLGKLTGVVSKCKSMTRSVDKRKQPELRAQAEEAYENLVAFIKYRRSVA